MSNLSPMMRQYEEAKAVSGDALLFFRMGDFYELFHEDAKVAAKVLGLTLTSRDKNENPVPMAGFPHHQLEGYLAKLIRSGYRAAVCEQVEDPKQAKGIVKREVTRIVTSGTLTEDSLLDPRQSNRLVAICSSKKLTSSSLPSNARSSSTPKQVDVGIAWVELSTGKFEAGTVPLHRLADELARLEPAEILIHEDDPVFANDSRTDQRKGSPLNTSTVEDDTGSDRMLAYFGDDRWTITKRPVWQFGIDEARRVLCDQFQIRDLAGMGWDEGDQEAIRAAGATLNYLMETQRHDLAHIQSLLPCKHDSSLQIDAATRRSLEITQTQRGERRGSLLEVVDHTCCPMGSRKVAEWLSSPSIEIIEIESRLDAVESLIKQHVQREAIRKYLADVYDLSRLISRVATGRCGPRDLQQIGRTLVMMPKLQSILTEMNSPLLQSMTHRIDLLPELSSILQRAFVDDCPLFVRDGSFIRQGFDKDLDGLRDLAHGNKLWVAKYQSEQIASTGITSLKVGFTSVFGYYLEVTNTHRDRIPANFIRKQTLKNAERYITAELKEYEEKILGAEERAASLETEIFATLRTLVQSSVAALQQNAEAIAVIDALTGFAELAVRQSYIRPTMVETSELEICDGRHPVLDSKLPRGSFVPNDTFIGQDHGSILVITGPNMAGKSTYIRQTALLVLMSQIGSFIPAKRAKIGIADRIFARVGASDELSRGQSTFMVEMVETARILNTATSRSLVILDEIGRGTSTYDGLSLAWAIVEHIHDNIQCRTLFATHYHELVQLEKSHSGVRNFNVAVKEWDDRLVFLHRIAPGGADKSYGIHVARLAGVPQSVNDRAKEILAQLEIDHLASNGKSKLASLSKRQSSHIQMTLFQMGEHPIIDQIRAMDVTQLTPMAALQLVEKWQRETKSN